MTFETMQVPAGVNGLPAESYPMPILFREAAERLRQRDIEQQEQDEEQPEKHPVLLCRVCGKTITSEDQRIEIAGSHQHTFFNPAGLVYELGCFRTAPGCSVMGEASSEFPWFADHVWRVVICAECGVHLGWQFASGENRFYGLILARLLMK